MLKLAGPRLGDFHVGNQGKNNVGRVSLLEIGFDSDGIRSVNENAGVLGSDDGFDHRGQVVDVRESLHAENDIVIGLFTGGSVFGSADNWRRIRQPERPESIRGTQEIDHTMTGLETFVTERF